MAGNLQFHPLVIGLFTAGLAALIGTLLPPSLAGLGVATWFLGVTYSLALRPHQRAADWGLSLGGLLDGEPLSFGRVTKEALLATLIGLGTLLLVAIPYWVGFVLWFKPTRAFDVRLALQLGPNGWPESELFDWILGHLLVVALPEEAFFRGYLQTALERRGTRQLRLLGATLGSGLLWSSALFALGHFLSIPLPSRLAVFFPSLLFGFLRARTGGIGASVVCHAACNVLVLVLSAGYGLHR